MILNKKDFTVLVALYLLFFVFSYIDNITLVTILITIAIVIQFISLKNSFIVFALALFAQFIPNPFGVETISFSRLAFFPFFIVSSRMVKLRKFNFNNSRIFNSLDL